MRDQEPRREEYHPCCCHRLGDEEIARGFFCGGCEEYRHYRDEWHRQVDQLTEADAEDITSW